MSVVNSTPPQLSLYEILEFWQNVDRQSGQGPHGDCWHWKLKLDRDGYGHLFIRFPRWRHLKASRFAFYLANDYWPSAYVLHKCDNPRCCNPAHLFEGTCQQNSWDALSKGRIPTGKSHWMRVQPHRVPRGSQRQGAKLTEAAVIKIRERVSHGALQKDVAREFNVSRSTVSLIILRKIWAHI